MDLSGDQVRAFGVALNEATVIAVDVKPELRAAAVTLGVLALPEDDGPEPADPRRVLLLESVGRIAASLRNGRWDDAEAPVETFALDGLRDAVTGFEQQTIHGWSFLDVPADETFDRWSDRLSLDWRAEPDGVAHTLDLFQESARGLPATSSCGSGSTRSGSSSPTGTRSPSTSSPPRACAGGTPSRPAIRARPGTASIRAAELTRQRSRRSSEAAMSRRVGRAAAPALPTPRGLQARRQAEQTTFTHCGGTALPEAWLPPPSTDAGHRVDAVIPVPARGVALEGVARGSPALSSNTPIPLSRLPFAVLPNSWLPVLAST